VIREVTFVATMSVASITASPIWLVIFLIVLFALRYVKYRSTRVIFSLLVIPLFATGMTSLLVFTVHKSISIGDMVLWGGSFFALCAWLALKPHRKNLYARDH
jgi:hypothetical protein